MFDADDHTVAVERCQSHNRDCSWVRFVGSIDWVDRRTFSVLGSPIHQRAVITKELTKFEDPVGVGDWEHSRSPSPIVTIATYWLSP